MNGYLDAVHPGQGVAIILAGVPRQVARARLGLHLRLARLAERFDALPTEGSVADAGLIREYLDACGLDQSEGTGVELLSAYVSLRAINLWQWDLPFMKQPGDPAKKPLPYEYQDRVWAWWVHRIASRYSWTRDEIFNLWPEEAAAYMQEIFVAEYDEADERRSLTEMGYHYDKASKKSRFIPLSRPAWMAGREEPKPRRVNKRWLPVGNLVNLDDLAKTLH
jgi:hypothetical protein